MFLSCLITTLAIRSFDVIEVSLIIAFIFIASISVVKKPHENVAVKVREFHYCYLIPNMLYKNVYDTAKLSFPLPFSLF